MSELRELADLARRDKLKPMAVKRRPLAEVNQALDDLHQGKVIGRTVLIPETA